jgi:hypothetical protein
MGEGCFILYLDRGYLWWRWEGRSTVSLSCTLFVSGVDLGNSELDAPALPTTFPDQLGALTGLQSFKVTGNNQLPGESPWFRHPLNSHFVIDIIAGIIPTSFRNLTALQTLQIQNTGLTGSLPDIFAGLKQLKNIGLASNVNMQVSLPPSLLSVPLQNL